MVKGAQHKNIDKRSNVKVYGQHISTSNTKETCIKKISIKLL